MQKAFAFPMKPKFVSKIFLVLAIGIQSIGLSEPSFSNSNCDVIFEKNDLIQIRSLKLWESFNNSRKQFLRRNQVPTQKDAAMLMKKVILIYESDKDVYLNIEKNKNCFAPKSIGANKQRLTSTYTAIDIFNKAISQITSRNENKKVYSGWPDNWKNLYSQFKHWRTGKILAKFKE